MPNTTELPTTSVMTLRGKTYRLKPLALGDLLELAKYLRDLKMSEAKRQMVGLPLELAKYAWDEAKKAADKIVVGTPECSDASLSFEGLQYGLWLGLRSDQPTLTLEDVQGMFNDDVTAAGDAATAAMGYRLPNPTTPPPTAG